MDLRHRKSLHVGPILKKKWNKEHNMTLSKHSLRYGLFVYLEPKWPLFLKVNPPKQGLFQSKQGAPFGVPGKLNIKINQTWVNRPHIECLGMGCHFIVLQYWLGPPWPNFPNSSTSSPEIFEFKKSASHHISFISPELVIRNLPCAYLFVYIKKYKNIYIMLWIPKI